MKVETIAVRLIGWILYTTILYVCWWFVLDHTFLLNPWINAAVLTTIAVVVTAVVVPEKEIRYLSS